MLVALRSHDLSFFQFSLCILFFFVCLEKARAQVPSFRDNLCFHFFFTMTLRLLRHICFVHDVLLTLYIFKTKHVLNFKQISETISSVLLPINMYYTFRFK